MKSLLAILILVLTACAAGLSAKTGATHHEPAGLVHYEVRGDTLRIRYAIEILATFSDSVIFRLSDYALTDHLTASDSALLADSVLFSVTAQQNGSTRHSDRAGSKTILLTGALTYVTPHANRIRGYNLITVLGRSDSNRNPVRQIRYFPLETDLPGQTLGLGLAGYTRNGFPPPAFSDNQGFAGSFELAAGYMYSRVNLSLSTIVATSLGDPAAFVYNDYLSVNARYYTGERNSLWPHLVGAVKWSRVKSADNDSEFIKKNFGAEIGAGFELPFERLSYSYTTSAGGYHRVDLFLSAHSTPNSKLGTMYSVYHGEYLRMVQIRLVLEGNFWGEEYPTGLTFPNHRPLPHKILAVLPAAPLYLAGVVFDFAKDIISAD